ncbi:MAG: polysaccharide pyruvyl transferase family protein [Candidatus Omnitrophica bacterium]|nr:polysaccharide pyruvyl transferase family protein [Candidatus Omnitrophota bacterium]
MKILLVHAWLTGNLGDLLQTYVLLKHIRSHSPTILDIAGYPKNPAKNTTLVTDLADNILYDEPAAEKLPVIGLRFSSIWQDRRQRVRAKLYAKYDLIVSAPGPFLTMHDERLRTALLDLKVAKAVGVPFIFSSHSIGPINPQQANELKNANLIVGREPESYNYLRAFDISSVKSADFAFLFPFSDFIASSADIRPNKTCLLFLRSNNLLDKQIIIRDEKVIVGNIEIQKHEYEEIYFATSDPKKDEKFLTRIATKLEAEIIICKSVEQLIAAVDRADLIVSDRYHPLICAAVLGKKIKAIMNQSTHKMKGIETLLSNHTMKDIQIMAETGLKSISSFLVC